MNAEDNLNVNKIMQMRWAKLLRILQWQRVKMTQVLVLKLVLR